MTQPSRTRRALVVGASRGLGLALTEELWSRGWQVVATARGPAPALEALAVGSGGAIVLHLIDIAVDDDVRRLGDELSGRTFDLLMVNAGISIAADATPLTADGRDFTDMMTINALAPVRLAEGMARRVRAGGVIAFMSSELASLEGNPGTHDLYSASKAALNMLARCFATRQAESRHAVLLVAPGWVRTEMGGGQAPLTIADSIPPLVRTLEANLDVEGCRFLDRFGNVIPW